MARHHDRLITQATAAAAAAGQPPPRTEPRSTAEIESYVKGFGLSAPATRQLVREWTADNDRARRQGYNTGYDDGQDSLR